MDYLRQFLYRLTYPLRALLYAPSRLFGTPKRLLGMSLPARVALLLAIFLVLVTIAAVLAYLLTPDRPQWEVWFGAWHILVIVGLLVAIPLVTYFTLKLWLEADVSRFPDIDRAWQAGLHELQRKGVNISDTPLFLVLGADWERLADSLMGASAMDFVVPGVPEGHTPLRWFAHENGIYLVATEVGCLTHINRLAPEVASAPVVPARDIRGTLERPSVRGTMTFGSPPLDNVDLNESFGVHGRHPAAVDFRGTLVPGAQVGGVPVAAAPTSQGAGGAMAVSRRDMEEQTERLQFVCQLLSKARQPLCPVNGTLALLSWDGIQRRTAHKELPESVRRDLDTIREVTRLCCPVTVLVAGMEAEPGFAELVRRVGVERATANRFGRGFDQWSPPTAENLDALTSHACGAFEDWVYDLFQQRDALGKAGNTKLYQLLCRIRSRVHKQLGTVLINGLAADTGERRVSGRHQLFGGCYFAATGDSADRRSFVKSVFQKMQQMEDELEWTGEAIRADRRCAGLANTLLAFNGLMLLALIGMLVYRLIW
ncbi:MAG: type VI secretion protein IcmF/TssM N-terminal domain-containing protein [Pirellulaceae bacterium]